MEFETRLVDSRLHIEFEIIDEVLNSKAIEEYNLITQLHNNSIDRWLHSLQVKSMNCKCGGSTLVLGEMLIHIYKKLEYIENLIVGSEMQYIPLKNIAHTQKLGHGIIVLDSTNLEIGQNYYVRFLLPAFPARCIPIFAIAKDINVLQINRIAERDLRDYDSYIVSVEREILRARRTQNL